MNVDNYCEALNLRSFSMIFSHYLPLFFFFARDLCIFLALFNTMPTHFFRTNFVAFDAQNGIRQARFQIKLKSKSSCFQCHWHRRHMSCQGTSCCMARNFKIIIFCQWASAGHVSRDESSQEGIIKIRNQIKGDSMGINPCDAMQSEKFAPFFSPHS